MQLAKIALPDDERRVAMHDEGSWKLLKLSQVERVHTLADILYSPDPAGLARYLVDSNAGPLTASEFRFLAPLDDQEVWAAGVTYKRSQVARMEESESGASHYDKVYTAPRPEIFFKATANRVSGPLEPLRVRCDSQWTVPEPELVLVVSPAGKLVGYTAGNDMSARDIEGENPLYLPQAKVYQQCCGLGPAILLATPNDSPDSFKIHLTIRRGGLVVSEDGTHAGQMARSFTELIGWLLKENPIDTGAFLFTGTGIIPPDNFSLENGDEVTIEIAGIGTLVNPIVKSAS
jgi:2-dehydro-3-deoxy-D-arabinonate dehydratase